LPKRLKPLDFQRVWRIRGVFVPVFYLSIYLQVLLPILVGADGDKSAAS